MPADLRREATAAWRRFLNCVQALPADEASTLWHTVQIEIAGFLCG
jgi:hypothetical protein